MNSLRLKTFAFFSSLTICFSFLALLNTYVFEGKTRQITTKQQTVIELELIDEIKKDSKKQVVKKKTAKNIKIKDIKTAKKSASKTNKKTSSIKSLFSKVKTKAKKATKKVVTNRKKSEATSVNKAKKEKQEKKTKVKKVSNNINSNNKKSASANVQNSGATDEYYSKIYQILSSRWRPFEINGDYKAVIIVYISNSGKFTYRFEKYSDNMNYDNQLMRFLDSQTYKTFPISKQKTNVTVAVTFETKN
ncbi:MAG: hypothetical protein B1H07_04155 [Campylobacteraceae bacterium 4484_166]|nr:MAG: hypothetical protein B1H07_04155 [Campylobacteraceae bacterium 4484_166]